MSDIEFLFAVIGVFCAGFMCGAGYAEEDWENSDE